mmetsp:Transcript_15298/g.33367  ORF Transcript_15298/g.33367 Transcript_15298/m.33367 type:complete len:97 (+) Transcript_15298:213-503(+)
MSLVTPYFCRSIRIELPTVQLQEKEGCMPDGSGEGYGYRGSQQMRSRATRRQKVSNDDGSSLEPWLEWELQQKVARGTQSTPSTYTRNFTSFEFWR